MEEASMKKIVQRDKEQRADKQNLCGGGNR